ncbi:MAG TPA: hypothetical protein VLK36_11005 [Gaiellaceae bacterium]|nr:hypothetical protein [Gaiellaceae bacterium]
MTSPDRVRAVLIGTLVVALVISIAAKETTSSFLGWLSFAVFLVAVFLYFQWRRALHNVRKGDETRTRTDQ